jgi:hypothetical protein
MLASVAGHASISGEGGSGSNGNWLRRNWWLWSYVKQAPVTQEIDVKNGPRSPRKPGSRRMYMNDRKRKMKVLRLIEQTMEIDELPENDERLLKKAEIKRDEMGRFEQHGTGLIKKSKTKSNLTKPEHGRGGLRAGAGRPKGAKGKIPLALKEAILASLDELGGKEYLKTLAIENSSAYAGLIGKVLPTTLDASDSSGGPAVITFQRVIVMPDGHKYIDGVTPKQLPAPRDIDATRDEDTKEINDLPDDQQI